jgi:hypothetical protein
MTELKRFVSKTSSYALLAVLASLLLAREAHAYLDPGTGSYIFQILLARSWGSLAKALRNRKQPYENPVRI